MYGRGYTLVAVNANGVVQESECFDTYASSYEAENMADFIDYAISNGDYVIGVVRNEASAHMTEEAYEALESLGCSLADSVGYRDSYVFIARKGYANNVKEKLVKHNEGFAQIEMAAAGQPLAWYWFDPGRAYDPMIGRWVSVDPLEALAPGLNPFHYVHNNPINRIDSFGFTDKKDDEKNIPIIDADFVIECVEEREKVPGYVWAGGSYFLVDENLRKLYEKIRGRRRNVFYKLFDAISSVLNNYNPAHVMNPEENSINGIIDGTKSVAKITKRLIKYYKRIGVAVELPQIKDFIYSIALEIASDSATNLVGPDLNSVYKKGNSGVDTTFHDIGVQRTIKTIHYYIPKLDTTYNVDFDF